VRPYTSYSVRWGDGAEEQIANVGYEGVAAGVDLVSGLELIEFSEGVETLSRTDDLGAGPCPTLLPLNYCGL
jgi:hypothetical protein